MHYLRRRSSRCTAAINSSTPNAAAKQFGCQCCCGSARRSSRNGCHHGSVDALFVTPGPLGSMCLPHPSHCRTALILTSADCPSTRSASSTPIGRYGASGPCVLESDLAVERRRRSGSSDRRHSTPCTTRALRSRAVPYAPHRDALGQPADVAVGAFASGSEDVSQTSSPCHLGRTSHARATRRSAVVRYRVISISAP